MAEKDQDSSALATVADYQAVFNTPPGKRVLRHLMKVHGMMQASFESNPYATAYNEGGRNAVIQILRKIRLDINKLEKEIKEQQEQGDSDVII